MNDAILVQLKVLVERVVRPVTASTAHKRKMREELLAHVTAVFEDEATRGDEGAAIQQTALRFGNPADLTRQLQETVPASNLPSRLVEMLAFPPGESTLRRALRHAGLIGLLTFSVLFGALALSLPDSSWTTAILLQCAGGALSLFLMVFGFYFFEDWMRHALFAPAGPSWRRVAVIAIACDLFYFAIPMLFEANRDTVDAWSFGFTMILWGSVMTFFVTTLAKFGALRTRYLEEWASLPINGTGGAA
jgi:hypothetical protein